MLLSTSYTFIHQQGKTKATESNQACVCAARQDALKNLDTNLGKENTFTSLEVMY
jgi:hypothetical protein